MPNNYGNKQPRPCPFCGEIPHVVEHVGGVYWRHEGSDCVLGLIKLGNEQFERWNMRSDLVEYQDMMNRQREKDRLSIQIAISAMDYGWSTNFIQELTDKILNVLRQD